MNGETRACRLPDDPKNVCAETENRKKWRREATGAPTRRPRDPGGNHDLWRAGLSMVFFWNLVSKSLLDATIPGV